jgi:hypothetical protein
VGLGELPVVVVLLEENAHQLVTQRLRLDADPPGVALELVIRSLQQLSLLAGPAGLAVAEDHEPARFVLGEAVRQQLSGPSIDVRS